MPDPVRVPPVPASGAGELSRTGRAGRMAAAAIWLLYLAQPVARLRAADGWQQWLGLAGTAGFVGLYLFGLLHGGPWQDERFGPARRWGLLAGLSACALATLPGAGDATLTFAVFLAAMTMAQLPYRTGIPVVVGLLILVEVAGWTVPGWDAAGNGLGVVLASFAVVAFRTAARRQRALLAAERELAEGALAAERARIARDLHDILGHSLTVVAVKAELAQRLLTVDPERARAELSDLEALTRDALADVRATTSGLRGISLPGEIAAARDALTSAGVRAVLPTATDDVPSRWRELFAWTVREGVTNVIRHSGARTCTIDVGPASVSVSDDGRGAVTPAPAGHGLDGLQQRTRLAGGIVLTGPRPDGTGFQVTVRVPAGAEPA